MRRRDSVITPPVLRRHRPAARCLRPHHRLIRRHRPKHLHPRLERQHPTPCPSIHHHVPPRLGPVPPHERPHLVQRLRPHRLQLLRPQRPPHHRELQRLWCHHAHHMARRVSLYHSCHVVPILSNV